MTEQENAVLDKIRAEIEAEPYISKMEVLDIIDKYKAEGARNEEKEPCKEETAIQHRD